MKTRCAVRRDRRHHPGWKSLFKPRLLPEAQLQTPHAFWPDLCTRHSLCPKRPPLPSLPDKFSHFHCNASTSEAQASSDYPAISVPVILCPQLRTTTYYLALDNLFICMSLSHWTETPLRE